MPIWQDAFLGQLEVDAEQDINKRIPCLFNRFYLPVTTGQSVYTLPSYVRSVRKISWLGKYLDAENWEELQFLTPATVFDAPNQGTNIEASVSRPLYYAMHPTNPYDVRLYPCPNQTLDVNPFNPLGDDPYSPYPNEFHCTVSCWRNIDSTFSDPNSNLPAYIDRRTRKAFILWKAFSAEGKGQNLKAAGFYKEKYEYLIEAFRAINEGTFVSKKYMIEDGMLVIDGFRYPRPFLPSNFERVYF